MKSLKEALKELGGIAPYEPGKHAAPRNKKELKAIIKEYTANTEAGEEVDLNWIDVSKVTEMNHLFSKTQYIPIIDKWDISRCKSFRSMFYENHFLEKSPFPVLQKNLLKDYCYESMFAGCHNLTVPPELPATHLTEGCYKFMFYDCSFLENAPELPAKNLAPSCYYGMFSKCHHIAPPKLHAMKLAVDCYENMFAGSKGLTDDLVPELPAEKLADGCYAFMFHDCIRLSRPYSKLPSEHLAPTCYMGMFSRSGIEWVPELPATELPESCYADMFEWCDKLKTFWKNLPEPTHTDRMCYDRMFSGCREFIKKYGDKLPKKSY